MAQRRPGRPVGSKKIPFPKKRASISLYESTHVKWNMLRKKLNKNHDEMAVYLLDIYEIYIQQSSDLKDMPHLTPIKTLKNTRLMSSTPNQNIHVNRSMNTPESIEFERTLPSVKFLQDEQNKVTVNDTTKMNESLPYDDLDLVAVQDSFDIASITADESTVYDIKDATYSPESSDTETESSSESDDDLLLGPSFLPNTFINNDEEDSVQNTSYVKHDENHPLIVFKEQLFNLANSYPPDRCTICNINDIECKSSIVGTSYRLKWVCLYGHVCHEWYSQPRLRQGVNMGDLQLSSALILSGNNFDKISLMFKFFKLPFVEQSVHYKFQKNYIFPSIQISWENVLAENRNRAMFKDIVLLCDGRMDSPGFCAKYCTYVSMDNETKDILGLEILDKREVSLKSTLMEKEGLVRTLEKLCYEGLNIKELVTDAHSQITKFMRENHPNKKHTHDIWHGAKNLGKKLAKASEGKDNRDIVPWIKDIVKHFWYCVKVSDEYSVFIAKWKGALHHVTGKHEWILGEGDVNCCDHEDIIIEDKPLITPNSPAHQSLRRVLYDQRFLRSIPYFLSFRSTDVVENFNSLILKYVSKRISYQYAAYKTRNQLAALDYQMHKDRAIKRNRNGDIIYRRKFNKNGNRWTVSPAKMEKEYVYIDNIMLKIIELFQENKTDHALSIQEFPSILPATIAPIPPPSTAELVSEHNSRFSEDV